MANELKPFGIELVTVAPGAFKTAMMDLGILPKDSEFCLTIASDQTLTNQSTTAYSYSRYAKRQCEQHITDVNEGPDPAPVFEAIVKSCTEPNPPLRRLAGDAVQGG